MIESNPVGDSKKWNDMKRKNTVLILSALWVVFCLPLTACALGSLKYSAEPIEARVVDAETKQPLEGVIITANWQLEEGTFGGNVQTGQLNVMETTTDKEGRFRFHGWGPLKVEKGHLVNRDPQLILFKSGYEYLRLVNEYSSDRELRLRPVRRSQWNGETIELMPFKMALEVRRKQALEAGEREDRQLRVDCQWLAERQMMTLDECQMASRQEHERRAQNLPFTRTLEEEYIDHFENLNHELDHIATDDPKECNWKKIPKAIRAMNVERKRLEELKIKPHRLSAIDNHLLDSDDYFIKEGGCGSPKEFFGGFQ